MFRPEDDPGPNFTRGAAPSRARIRLLPSTSSDGDPPPFEIRHGTTIAAIRYADGVVMAGDRRATAGSSIAHRTMEKVHPADRHSGVAIAGAAGPAMEMVRLFQLQLEHYEKVEGAPLSLEGKANQLSQMVRSNLAMAMQGFVVVPAVRRLRRAARAWAASTPTTRPAAATRRPTSTPTAPVAGTPARPSSSAGRPDLSRADAIELAVRALWQAADEDSATGRPGRRAGHLPDGGHHHRRRLRAGAEEAEVAERFAAVVADGIEGSAQP